MSLMDSKLQQVNFADLKAGDSTTMHVLVRACTKRLTKAGKPYLQMTLFDGFEEKNGNYWELKSQSVPSRGEVVLITADITVWQGATQLNIQSMQKSNVSNTEFAPQSGYNVDLWYESAEELAQSISNNNLRGFTQYTLSNWKDLWMTAPGATGVHHAYVAGTLIHSVAVAHKAYQMATLIDEASTDLCIAGGLLHDIGKLKAYSIVDAVPSMTDVGKLQDHIVLGVSMLDGLNKYLTSLRGTGGMTEPLDHSILDLLKHIVLSHHSKKEWGSPVEPACVEAHIVAMADMLDATTEQIRVASNKMPDSMFTDKIYTLGNREALNYLYIRDVMDNT